MTKETKTIVLTAEQLKKQGLQLTDAMTRLSVLKNYANAMMLSMNGETDRAILLSCLQRFISEAYDQADVLYRELDGVASRLIECDDPEELKALGVAIAGGLGR